MFLILLGLLLWSGVHFWKRIAPDSRARFGDKGKGIVALGSVLAIVLMVIGYRGAEGTVYWGRNPATVGIADLLMVFAFYLFAASGAKTRITKWVRNPQLTAVKLWAIAHLLVNGDTPSFLLFGGMFMISTLGMVLTGSGGRGGGNRSATVDEDRRDYLRYLAQLRRRVRDIAGEQRAVLESVHPEVAAWPAVLAAGRLW
ncbi:NnrU family protein, partial [Pseudorhodobacter sp.]|uniref:NnrU family protein n=1 Tax=Pseudorhodobacter sp. TaxID=1934400 RepID=UPI002647CE73